MELKNDALYMKSHEWVVIDGDTATVGISEVGASFCTTEASVIPSYKDKPWAA